MKRLLSITLIAMICFGFAFAQGGQEATAETVSKEPRVLQFAYTSLPGSDTDKGAQAVKEKLNEISGGMLQLNLYPGGELYTQDGQATAIRRGTLDITLFGVEWLAGLKPELGSLCSAYSIVDLEHLNRIFNEDNEVSQYIEKVVNDLNLVPISTWYFGKRTLNLRGGQNVTTPEQMKNVKLRMSNSAGFIAMGKALGAVPTPMNLSEVYMALKNGTIDGQDNPLSTMINRKFYEVTDTVILTNHYVSPITIYVSMDTWKSLSAQEQEWLREAFVYGKTINDALVNEAEEKAVDFLREQGMTIVEVDKSVWAEYAYAYYEVDPIGKEWDQDFYSKVKSLAK